MSDASPATTQGPPRSKKAFIPLECNPEVMTSLIHNLGISPALAFHDVYSLDDPELLSFVPRPALALLLVFPVTKTYDEARRAEDADKEYYTGKGDDEPVVWFPQTIKNACGMMGVLHGVLNGETRSHITPGSALDKLLKEALPLDAHGRAHLLETTPELESAHQSAASDGQTVAPDANDEIETHYIAFVKSAKDGHLYELDGSRKGPLDRGALAEDEDVLSENALKAVKAFIAREQGGNINFSIVALAQGFD